MRNISTSLVLCLLVAVVHKGTATRDLQQFTNLGTSAGQDVVYPSSEEDYTTTICYSPLDVLALLNSTDNLTYLQEALFSTGLAEYLFDPTSTLTLLAPTDDAFLAAADALDMDINDLLDSPILIPVLFNHIIRQPITSDLLSDGDILRTALGQYLNVTQTNDTLEFSSLEDQPPAMVVDGDVCNCDSSCAESFSVVQVIDAVLLVDIQNVTSQNTSRGLETRILIGDPAVRQQLFVVVDPSTLPAAPDVVLPLAPAPGLSSTQNATSQNSTGVAPSGGSATPPSANPPSTMGVTTTANGMTYFTNSAANS